MLTLTEQGKKAAHEIETKIMYALGQMVDSLGDEESENFIRILDKLILNLPNIIKNCEERFKEMDDNYDKNI